MGLTKENVEAFADIPESDMNDLFRSKKKSILRRLLDKF